MSPPPPPPPCPATRLPPPPPPPPQGANPLDPAPNPRHLPPRLAGPPPLVDRVCPRPHQEIRALHPVGDVARELHGALIWPQARHGRGRVVARHRLEHPPLEREPCRVRAQRAVVPAKPQSELTTVVHRLYPHAGDRWGA